MICVQRTDILQSQLNRTPPQFSKAVEGLNAEMLWTMMYIYGNLDYPVVVISDLRIKSNESLGRRCLKYTRYSVGAI